MWAWNAGFLKMWVAHLSILMFILGTYLCLYVFCTNASAMFELPKPPMFKRGRRTKPEAVGKSISQTSDSLHVGFSCDHWPWKPLGNLDESTFSQAYCSFSFPLGTNRWWQQAGREACVEVSISVHGIEAAARFKSKTAFREAL